MLCILSERCTIKLYAYSALFNMSGGILWLFSTAAIMCGAHHSSSRRVLTYSTYHPYLPPPCPLVFGTIGTPRPLLSQLTITRSVSGNLHHKQCVMVCNTVWQHKVVTLLNVTSTTINQCATHMIFVKVSNWPLTTWQPSMKQGVKDKFWSWSFLWQNGHCCVLFCFAKMVGYVCCMCERKKCFGCNLCTMCVV